MRYVEPKNAVVLGNPDTMKPLGKSKKDLQA